MVKLWKPAPAVKPIADQFPKPKPTQQYEKPIGPEKPVPVSKKEKVHNALKKAGDYVAPRIKRVAENAQRGQQRDSGMINISPPKDMFSFQAPSFMMGAPRMGMQEPAAPRPRRRKSPKKKSAPRRQSSGGGQNWQQLGAVPDSVKRWMM